MKIGIVSTWFERGAAHVTRAYDDILSADHDVFIYARGGEEYAIGVPGWDNERVTWGKRLDVSEAAFVELEDFRAWVINNNLDLVFFNEQSWWPPVLLCNCLGVVTGAYVDYYTAETVPLFGCYDFLVCNTQRHHEVFSWHPNAYYVPWGTDIKVFRPITPELVTPESVTFFHSAGYSPFRKGTDLVLQAFAGLPFQAKLVLHSQVGRSSLSPCSLQLATELEQEGKLVWHVGAVGAPGLYHLGDVYVYPSRLDGVGLTVPEALACGLPVLTSDFPPLTEFISPHVARTAHIRRVTARVDGYYWPMCEVDVEDLRCQMAWYLEHADQLPALKCAARSFAEQRLDWRSNAAGIPDLFARMGCRNHPDKSEAEGLALQYEKRHAGWDLHLYYCAPRRYQQIKRLITIFSRWVPQLDSFLASRIRQVASSGRGR